jgi:Flp pilus assembly secretin CpaC
LFFQKLSRRTILVADQNRRAQYQQLVLRTFFLANMKPSDARQFLQQAIPPSVGRPQPTVVADDATNSLTVRDTAENVRLMSELLKSVDKDRAEVVMDVNIYEVSRSDLMQFGNQIGGSSGIFNLGGSPGLSVLSSNGALNNLQRGVNLASIVGGVPTAAAAALVIPPSVLTAFQSRDNTRLIASTQVHAFNGEESTARIGQRVPVQTAQAYPFGIQTGTSTTNTGFPSGGFPVINYEPTGLTLKFTPQVFPNLDVQVKMSIESKDVLGAGTLTPTFTERTITGTARVQNNRTMMLASVAQDVQTNGRRGLPILGLMPVLGRLFSSPTRDNRQVDIVIAVTPRVLRAPAVTPRDEDMRPSGTLSAPTTGSLEALIREADHDDQMAAARRLPTNAVVQLPDVDPGTFAPAMSGTARESVRAGAAQTNPLNNAAPSPLASGVGNANSQSPDNTATSVPAQKTTALLQSAKAQTEELPSFVPAPKSLVNNRSASEVAAVNTGTAGTADAVLTSLPKPINASATPITTGSSTARLSFAPAGQAMRSGEKRKFGIELNSDVPLGFAVLALRFDPKVVKVRAVSGGSFFSDDKEVKEGRPSITQSIDPSGLCFISISAPNNSAPMKGKGTLVFLEVEAVASGYASFTFDRGSMHFVGTDGHDVAVDLTSGRATVKQ